MKNYTKIFALALFLSTFGCNIISRSAPPPELVFTPSTLPEAVIGKPYSVKISVSNALHPIGDASIGEGQFPEGLIIQKQSMDDAVQISGTPQEPGIYDFRLDVITLGTNTSGQSGKKLYKIVVKEK